MSSTKKISTYYMGTLFSAVIFTAIMFFGLDRLGMNYYVTYGLAYLITLFVRFYYNCHVVFKKNPSITILWRLLVCNVIFSILSSYFIYLLEQMGLSRVFSTILVTCIFIGLQYRIVENFVFKLYRENEQPFASQ